jgi:inorganic phosphate transporter, PiT family
MFGVCLASFIFIITSSLYAMPISGTHTVIGALLGAGLISTGFNNLNWSKLGLILISWFISPIIAALFSYILMMLVSSLTLDTRNRTFKSRIYFLQLISSFSFGIIAVIISVMIEKKNQYKTIALLGASIFGLSMCRLVLLNKLLTKSSVEHF